MQEHASNVPSPSDATLTKVSSLSLDEAVLGASGLPNLEEHSLGKLRASIADVGIIEPIAVWSRGEKMIVLDGVARFKIATECGITECPIHRVESPTLSDAIMWRIEKNLSRRHLSNWGKCRVALAFISQISEKRQNGEGCKWEQAEKFFGISKDTISKAGYILKNGETYYGSSTFEEIKSELNLGNESIYRIWTEIKTKDEDKKKKSGKPKGKTNDNDVNPQDVSNQVEDISTEEEYGIKTKCCIEGLKEIAAESIDLVVTSPPYHGVKTDYNGVYDCDAKFEKVTELLSKLMKEIYRVIKEGGVVAFNVDNATSHLDVRDEQYRYDLIRAVKTAMCDAGLIYFDEITWIKDKCPGNRGRNGSIDSPRFRREDERIVMFSKGSVKKMGDRTQPKNMTKQLYQKWTRSAWTKIAAERRKSITETHPHPFPEEIPHRLIRLFTYPGATVCDPFSGSGTTAAVAKQLHRNWVCFDLCEEYNIKARKRVERAEPQPL